MTDKHTPGPWQFDELGIIYSGDCAELCAHHSNDHVVAILSGARPEDARLIAAAPLMLDALREARLRVAAYEQSAREHGEPWFGLAQAVQIMDTAIAAATGEDA